MSTELQIAMAIINFLLVILVGVLYKLRDADRKAANIQIGNAELAAARADARAEKAQQMAVDNLARIHDQERSVNERMHQQELRNAARDGDDKAFRAEFMLRQSAQDEDLSVIREALGRKASKREMLAVTGRSDPRVEPDSDAPPPPMRGRLPSVRGR